MALVENMTFYLDYNATVPNVTKNTTDDPAEDLPGDVKLFIISLICVIILIGVLGNISVILIVTRVREMRKPVYYCLSSLALSDTLVLSILPLIPLASLFGLPAGVFGWNFCKFSGFFDRGAAVASVLTVFMISVERYFAICHPFRARYVLTPKRTVATILLIWVLATAVSFPYLEMVEAIETTGPNNSTLLLCYFADKTWMHWYECIVVVLFFFLPGLILGVLYFWIVKTVLRDNKHRDSIIRRGTNHPRHNSRKNKQVVFMLAGVVVMFIVCVLPHNIFIVVAVALPNISDILGRRTYMGIMWFCRIMMYINSAGNPVIYNVVSSEYRHALRKALRWNTSRRYHHPAGNTNSENGFHKEKTMSTYSL